MKKFVLIIGLTTTIILVSFFGIYFYNYNNNLTTTTNLQSSLDLNYSDYIEIDKNLKITKELPNKLTSYNNTFFKKIRVPTDWKILDNSYNFYSYYDTTDFIFIRKFYFKEDSFGFSLDINKSNGIFSNNFFGPNLSEEEINKLELRAEEEGRETLNKELLFKLSQIEELIANYSDAKVPPVELLNFEINTSIPDQQIGGLFTFSKTYYGNDRYLHEYFNESLQFIWVTKDSNESLIYVYGFSSSEKTRDLLRILVLNLE